MADHRRNMLAYLIDLLRRSRLVRLWAPVFLWMGVIFYFSSRPNPLGFLSSSKHGIVIDPLAHIGEYAGLTVLLHCALREPGSPSAKLRTGRGAVERWSRGEEGDCSPAPPHLSSSALIAFAYALFDELHQELTPGRGFELADIGYDLAGIIATLGVIWLRGREKGQRSKGAREQGSRGAWAQGSRGARESTPLHLRTSTPPHRRHPSTLAPLQRRGLKTVESGQHFSFEVQ